MAALDKVTREAIMATVKNATIEMQEMYHEQWLTADQLCHEIPFFTREWLKRYGQTLPRECVRVTDAQGIEHRTGWCYPKMQLLRMVHDGDLRGLSIR